MKRPKWTDKGLPAGMPASMALEDAAKVLRVEAKIFRKDKNRDAAFACEYAARRLEEVARGKTWSEAFDWPKIDGGEA